MGVSKFHAWLNDKYGAAVTDARGQTLAADHVLVATASVAQSAARRCKSSREAVKRVVGRVESVFSQPRHGSAHAARGPASASSATRNFATPPC